MGARFYDDLATDPKDMQWQSARVTQKMGSGGGGAGDEVKTLPIGLHFTVTQRREHRLARAGIVVVRRHHE